MSVWNWVLAVIVALLLLVAALIAWRWSELSPFIRGMLRPPASEEAIRSKWSADGLTSYKYRQLLESGIRLELMASVLWVRRI